MDDDRAPIIDIIALCVIPPIFPDAVRAALLREAR